ncbi:MAG: DEAD/DEAH box helicase family protein [Desulfocapsa sp.]|nr:DEAD/DEAH box helicase family protein [Desulfocapsa sp.]
MLSPPENCASRPLARLVLRLPSELQSSCSVDILADKKADFFVQTSAYLHRHYYKIPADRFDYIVVDEAHHAAALGLRNILEHFTPTHLLGVTATPERFDQQRLEKIFGEYEPQLSLEEAIRQGLVPPVRCFRIKSNIDLSEVRFNGKEYVKNDLQRTLLVPSRDRLVAEVLQRYFGGEFSHKQGVVFCVDIKHARRMAKLLNGEEISAAAVDGRDRKSAARAQQDYDSGAIRFLCACDLLTEGWDAPQTAILVMARPTFSKVLYTQQLGRGLRNHPGKEALYVLDVVDNYGARLQPLSLHALFRIPDYKPFADLVRPERFHQEREIIALDGLYEGERRVEPVDIFSFEEKYGAYLNEEQLARELFVSTGTVRKWLKHGKIKADVRYPFGRQHLHFFDPDQVAHIRRDLGLQKHTTETRVNDFKEFLEKRDYTFSYKIIFLLAFLKSCNERFEALLPDILELYQRFYMETLAKYSKNERPNCPYNQRDVLGDQKKIQRSLLQNPFEKFERKRFFYQCKDLNYLALDPELIQNLEPEDFQQTVVQLTEDLQTYYLKLEITLEETDYAFLLPESFAPEEEDADRELFSDIPPEADKFTRVLPYYPLSIAAGDFMDSSIPDAPETWFVVEGLTSRRSLAPSMFVARIQGKSMEPLIPDGAYCLFSFEVGGSRNGRIVLAQQADISDQDTGASYTVKSYQSSKRVDPDNGWQHESITLKALNPDYDDIIILPGKSEDFRVVAIFVEVLTAAEA